MTVRFQVRSVRAGDNAVTEHVVMAASEAAMRAQLIAQGYALLSVKPLDRPRLGVPRLAQRKHFPLFCREVRTLIQAGMTVVEATDTLSAKERAEGRRGTLAAELLAALEQGKSLSAALEGLADAPPVLVAAVRAGERTSNLAEALDDYLRFDSLLEQLRRKVLSAAIYPALVTALGIGISLFLLMVVMPNFARMYQNLRGAASGTTAVVIVVSEFISQNRLGVMLTFCALVAVAGWCVMQGHAKRWSASVAFAVPWIRRRVEDFQLAMMYQALALLLRGGYAMTEAMTVASQAALSPGLSRALGAARDRVGQGGSVSRALTDEKLCDEVARRLLGAAERNGDFHVAADVVSRMYSERFELFVERTTRIVEPVLLMLVALVVGTLVVLMYLPVFDMATRL